MTLKKNVPSYHVTYLFLKRKLPSDNPAKYKDNIPIELNIPGGVFLVFKGLTVISLSKIGHF